ncbi:MAG: PEP-CTERM sorting domain-containing protein [Opitutales bacterium]|nr:PEP-CTERM sorting domain-containing protein [Opitutales bacterium]
MIVSNTWTAANLRIERTAADQYTLTSTYGALTFNPFVITTSLDFELDQVWIGINNRGTSFDIDNLVVTAIPEPSTYAALIGLLALGFVAYRRRRG